MPTPTDDASVIPQATVIVPLVLWEGVKLAAKSPEPAPHYLQREMDRLDGMEALHRDPEEGSISYQILDVLAKSDGNLSTHMTRQTLSIMYGEMVRNLTETFTITRKDQTNG